MDRDKLNQFADIDDRITQLESVNVQLKENIATNVKDIKELRVQRNALMAELRPAFKMRSGPKPKVERKRKPKKTEVKGDASAS